MNDIDTKQLALWLAATDIAELELHSPTGHERLWRGAGAAAPRQDAPSVARIFEIAEVAETAVARGTASAKASSVGIFLDRHPLRAAPFVRTGDAVTEGQTVGLLQIGALLLPVTAPCGGIAGAWHVAPGTVVGYGTALLDIASHGNIA